MCPASSSLRIRQDGRRRSDPLRSGWITSVRRRFLGSLRSRPNHRYALLFRDCLWAHPAAAEAYAEIKRALARLRPGDADAYYSIKDPVCDVIVAAAEPWAVATDWEPGSSDG